MHINWTTVKVAYCALLVGLVLGVGVTMAGQASADTTPGVRSPYSDGYTIDLVALDRARRPRHDGQHALPVCTTRAQTDCQSTWHPPHTGCPVDDGGTEHSRWCVWDAHHMGDCRGRSYWLGHRGRLHWVTHHRAHHLVRGWLRHHETRC